MWLIYVEQHFSCTPRWAAVHARGQLSIYCSGPRAQPGWGTQSALPAHVGEPEPLTGHYCSNTLWLNPREIARVWDKDQLCMFLHQLNKLTFLNFSPWIYLPSMTWTVDGDFSVFIVSLQARNKKFSLSYPHVKKCLTLLSGFGKADVLEALWILSLPLAGHLSACRQVPCNRRRINHHY